MDDKKLYMEFVHHLDKALESIEILKDNCSATLNEDLSDKIVDAEFSLREAFTIALREAGES